MDTYKAEYTVLFNHSQAVKDDGANIMLSLLTSGNIFINQVWPLAAQSYNVRFFHNCWWPIWYSP